MNEFLKPWQQTSAEHLLGVLQNSIAAADMSDTGIGKTFVALAVAQALQLPTLVVCPKISRTAWSATAEEFFGERFSITNYESLRTGRSGYGDWTNQKQLQAVRSFIHVCQRCLRRYRETEIIDPCLYSAGGQHCFDSKPRPIRRGEFRFNRAISFLIFDEAHRCGDSNSLNAEMLLAAKRQGLPHLLLSATLAESPLKLRAIGYSLGLHNDKSDAMLANGRVGAKAFYGWAARNGCRRDPRFHGWKWIAGAAEQKSIMSAIRAQIIPSRGVRVRCEEIPGFPEQVISADLIDLDEPATRKIKELYVQLEEEGHLEITKILKVRQEIELLKIPAMLEISRDRMQQGFFVGLFVNFRETVANLSRSLEVPFIDGTVTGQKRDSIISSCQDNSLHGLVLNSEAAGICINLQDLDGQHPRFGIVSPPWSAVTFRQLTGRFRREGGRSKSFFKVLFAAGTVEVNMHRALRGKLNALDSLNDNDLQPQNLHLTSG